MEYELAFAIAILITLVLLATIDMAFSHLSDLGLRRLMSESEDAGKEKTHKLLVAILDDRPRFRFALSSAIQFLLISFAVLITTIALRFEQNPARLLFISLIIGLTSTVLFRQLLPRLIVRGRVEQVLLFLLPVLRPIYAIAAIITRPIENIFEPRTTSRAEMTSTPDADDDRGDADENIQALLEVGEAEGIIEEEEREMIESMVEFAETRVGEIMTPRTEICALPIEATVADARNKIVEEKYSRLPVYRGSIDSIEGIIYVRDLLQVWAAGGNEAQPIANLVREPFFVPETKSAAELLKAMQINHVQLAIVIDEYGGVAGIVTVEDIIEEIVGEIEDEDIENEEIVEIIEGKDGYFDILGSTEIDKLERVLDVELADDDFTTAAGMVISEIGHVPKEGEKFIIRGLEVEVLKADEKKLSLLRVRKLLPLDNSETPE